MYYFKSAFKLFLRPMCWHFFKQPICITLLQNIKVLTKSFEQNVALVHGKTIDEWHTDDILVHMSDIRVTYEYSRVTYGWHTDDIRVHTSDIRWHTSTYEWNADDIRVHTSDIRMIYQDIRVTYRWHTNGI